MHSQSIPEPLDIEFGELKQNTMCLDTLSHRPGEEVGMFHCHGMGGNQVREAGRREGIYFLHCGMRRATCDERKIDERGKRVSVCVGRERATWLFLCYIHR